MKTGCNFTKQLYSSSAVEHHKEMMETALAVIPSLGFVLLEKVKWMTKLLVISTALEWTILAIQIQYWQTITELVPNTTVELKQQLSGSLALFELK